MGWRKQTEDLFFNKHLTIREISERLGISRQHISKYLNKNKEKREKERERRKKETRERQKERRREYDRERRCGIDYNVTEETLKREHETAVRILSHEKYYR